MAHQLALILVLSGCHTFLIPEHCDGACIADPIPHCIREVECDADADCPSGLECSAPPQSSTACSTSGIDDRRTCRWTLPFLDAEALIAGFQTRTMRATVFGGADPRIEWTPPPEAAFVKCALFTCNPTVLPRDVQNDADRSPTGAPLLHIANAQACVLDILAPTDAGRASLPLRAVSSGYEAICDPERSYDERVVDFLAAACWAYDRNDLIAASEVIPVDLEVARVLLSKQLPTSCGSGMCYDTEHEFLGVCADDACRPRCADTVDCELAATTLYHQPPGAPGERCRWDCRPVEGSRVGVCVPLP